MRALKATVICGLLLAAASVRVTADQDTGTILHVLGRIGFGAKPGDLERVRALGLDKYIEEQLNPAVIPDSAGSKTASFETLGLSSTEIAGRFYSPPPQQNARQANLPLLELSQQKLLRAVYSERQLEEVLVDFWFNHFNVFAGKGQFARFYLTEYERDAIRPHVLGRFREMLGATAKSPAMLWYLDNWMSAAPQAAAGDGAGQRRGRRPAMAPPQANARAPRGLNENYGRELLELHTLGVDGGYTQKDVIEVARAFTGWTIDAPRRGGGAFMFNPRLHDDGEKMVLGHRIAAGGGRRDGEQVLDILARHPSTARHIARKLATRFVSDDPPAALVERAAAIFLESGGDLKQVTRAIVTAPEFFAAGARRSKIKTPFEFVVSALRSTGADVRTAAPLVQQLRTLGMPLYGAQPPTGYDETSASWVNSGALINRMNFAVALVSNRILGTRVTLDDVDPDAIVPQDVLSPGTRATVAQASDTLRRIALLLGSPEFQKR
jgi:uncharacterized protein (DUF1800 family)